jgi:transposase InsO family protein
MNHPVFVDGAQVVYENVLMTVNRLPNDWVSFTAKKLSMKPISLTIHEAIGRLYQSIFPANHKQEVSYKLELSESDLIEIQRKQVYVDELLYRSKTGGPGGTKIRQEVIQYVCNQYPEDSLGASPAALARWLHAYQNHPHGLASTLRKPCKTRASRFSGEERNYAIKKMEQYLFVEQKPTLQEVFDKYVDDLKEEYGEDANYPCYKTFADWVGKYLNPFDLLKTQYGKRTYNSETRIALKRYAPKKILDRVEADAVSLAVGLIDEEGHYLGRVMLFTVIDCYSRAVLGVQVQIGTGERVSSVIDSLKHAISYKDPDSYSDEAINDWPMHGGPARIVVDGGPAYKSGRTQSFIMETTGQGQIVQTYAGHKKPFVESFNNTLRRTFAKTLPGYLGKQDDQKKLDVSIEDRACMTLDQFYDALTHWIIDEYHQAPHSALGGEMTPHKKWVENAYKYPPELPSNYEHIRYRKGDVKRCKISGQNGHLGITLNYLRYNDSGRLQNIHIRTEAMGEETYVTCEYSPNNITSITVIDPFTDEAFEIETYDERVIDGMTLAEFKAAYPPPKKEKGYGRSRVSRTSKTIAAAKKVADKKKLDLKGKKSTPANTDGIRENMNEFRAPLSPEVPPVETANPANAAMASHTIDDDEILPTKKGFDYE